MAEFQEVMRHLNRLCKKYPGCSEDGCPVFENECCGNIGAYCSKPLKAERIERIVLSWAAENPEPVYPTWFEWFEQMKIAERIPNPKPYYADDVEYHTEQATFTPKIFDHIPADIAEKLGVEPKENPDELDNVR